MSSPITLSGFNNVDFGLIIDAILEQERLPIRVLEDEKAGQQAKLNAYKDLGSQLVSLESTIGALAPSSAFELFTATTSNDDVLGVAAGPGASVGTHTVVVDSLARAQVLASTSLTASLDTAIADAGSLTIGGQTYTAAGSTTLEELRDRINSDEDAVARASLVDTGAGYRMVLTAKDSGTDAAFTVENNLTLSGGAPGVGFADTDGDGVSGDSAADNAVAATDASFTVDNVAVTRSSNVINGAIPGLTMTLTAEGTTNINVERDVSAAKTKIESFVDAYNQFSSHLQQKTIGEGELAGDFFARSISSEVRSILRSSHGTTGAFRNLAEIGIAFDKSGSLRIDDARLDKVLSESLGDVRKLFQVIADASDSRVTVLSSPHDAGTYDVSVTSLATSAAISGSTAIHQNGINQDETLTISYGTSSVDVLLPRRSEIADIISLVNTALDGAGIPITASNDGAGVLVLATDSMGSAESLTVISDVEDRGNGQSTGIGTTLLSASGTDIQGSLGGVAATGSGNVLTAAPGSAAEGLSVRIATGETGSHGSVTLSGGLAQSLSSLLDGYIGTAGLLSGAEDRIEDAMRSLDDRMASLESYLVLREQELRAQFTAADQALSALNSQQGALQSIASLF